IFAAFSRDPARSKVEYFPAKRRLVACAPLPGSMPASEGAEARVRLAKDRDKYDGLVGHLRAIARADAGRLDQLAAEQGVVLSDEPELHLHAVERVRFLQTLVALGRDNQVVVATGSAEIVAAAAPGQMIHLSAPARRAVPR